MSRRTPQGGSARDFSDEDVGSGMKEIGRSQGDETSDRGVDEDEEEDNEAIRPPLLNNSRKKFNPVVWKMFDEMIGFSIPRKARTAYVKRSPESREAVRRHASTSPLLTSTLSSDISIRKKKKKKPTCESKHRMPKGSSSPSSIQDIEIEVAEVLFGLTRQFEVPIKENSDQLLCKEEDDRSRSFIIASNTSMASSPPSTPKRKTRHYQNELHLTVSPIRKTVDGSQNRVLVPNQIKISEPSKTENGVFSLINSVNKLEDNPSNVKEQVVAQKEERKLLSNAATYDELYLNPAESDVKCISVSAVGVLGRKISSFKSPERESQKDLKERGYKDIINYETVKIAKFDSLKEDKERTSSPREEPTSEKTGVSFPWLMPGTAWPGGLPFGYMGQSPLLQPNGPVDGHNQKVGIKRCTIHFHIAQNIFLHQKISQANPLWSIAAAKAYENPTLISPNGKASNLKSPSDFTQIKHHIQVTPANNSPLPPAFFFPISQPRVTRKSIDAQYVLLQNNGYHPPPIGILSGSLYQHPQWQQLALSSSNPNQQQIPVQSMKPDTITPQAIAMAYVAASGSCGLNPPIQKFPELAARKGHEDGQPGEDGGRNYQNTLSRSGPTTAPHLGPVSFEATFVTARSSLPSGKPSAPSILEKAQTTTFQQHHRPYTSQLLFTNATAPAGYYFRQESVPVQNHALTMDGISLASSTISLAGRQARVSGNALKANGAEGLTLPTVGAPLSSTTSTVGKSVATSADSLKDNGVKSLTLPNFKSVQFSGNTLPYLGLPVLDRAAEQKSDTTGNESLHPCWQQPEKRLKKAS